MIAQAYQQALAEDQRLCILRVLEASPQYTANTATLEIALTSIGHPIGRTAIEAQCQWLADANLATVTRTLDGAVMVVQATRTGTEVATGTITRAGVKRPSASE
ncbi:MAG: ArsR family transcriptional regulator [Alphaproteobacteria bacterium]|nr:ArsR family transcriptional regulator [Alphaproteobacteria bacterium]